MEKLTTYRDVVINFDPEYDRFEAKFTDEFSTSSTSLKKLKEKIDNYLDNDKEKVERQKKQKCITLDDDRKIREVTVGTFGKMDYYNTRIYAWVTGLLYASRTRVEIGRMYGDKIFLDTPKNREALEKVIKLQLELDKLQAAAGKKKDAILKQLTEVGPTVKLEELPVWEK
jgi:hypothetical protein